MEEERIKVKNLRYVTSCRGLPAVVDDRFMAGGDSGEIVIDPKELLVPNTWYRYDDLPLLPPPGTVARRLIEDTATCRAEYD